MHAVTLHDDAAAALDREQPHDAEAERAVLGSILAATDPHSVVDRLASIDVADFFDQRNRDAFAAIKRLVGDGRDVDLITLKDELARSGQVVDAAYLSSLVDGIPNIASVESYAAIVASKASARKAIKTFTRAALAIADGRATGDAIRETRPILDAISQRESASNHDSDQFSLCPLSDFLAEPSPAVQWLTEGLLLRGGVVLLCAKPKAGKSTVARDAAFAVATGTPFLSRRTSSGKVVFIALEEHRDRLRSQLDAMGFNGDEPIFLYVGAAPKDGVGWLREIIARHHPDLVIIDPVFKLIRVSDVNAYAESSAALEPLVAIARESGACLLAVHHANKLGDGNGGESVLGSTAIFGAADVVMMLKRRDDQARTVSTIQRYGEDMPETVLEMDADTGLLGIAGTYEDRKLESVVGRITDALKSGAMMTEEAIRAELGGDRTLIAKALRHAAKTGVLKRTGKGRRGDPFQYTFAGGHMLAS